jgi:sarcosine oxidase subunit delta
VSFLMSCPNCGPRSAYEFHCAGEYQKRPAQGAPEREWARYRYFRKNHPGEQLEWWLHSTGCRCWFLARRVVASNKVISSFWPHELGESGTGPGGGGQAS